MYRQITACRICGGEGLDVLLELGTQYLTGVFPRRPDESLTKGPLTLVRCDNCGLVQLLHSYERTELYGAHYGYRSSLNRRMVSHLENKAKALMQAVELRRDDVVVDIGSNDGTLLSCFSGRNLTLLGVDPSAARWQAGYPSDSRLIADFFTADVYRKALGHRKARLVTSIAMFYDLERPLDFAHEVADVLADDGVWHLEQSYMPEMLRVNAYDTICHEHVEYYGLSQIKWLADKVGLAIYNVECNDVNGGSFAVTLGRNRRVAPRPGGRAERLLDEERRMGFESLRPFEAFRSCVLTHKHNLRERLEDVRARGMKVLGYGASTKGNVILQFAGIDRALLPAIAEVNDDKFGCVTPGTWIPIISETDARAAKPDYFMVLPWHFRAGIVQREAAYLRAGGRLLFPLPTIDVVAG
jgi:C-methyltransferase C-terminal domain/Putative zinc binding domain/Methyltransferase domain